jgi:ribonucleoside-diphosphate reductase alpha chain
MLKIERTMDLEPVYDITVPETSNFFANGILVHNCIEITNFAGRDHHGKDRTAVCCLSSINQEKTDEFWPYIDMLVEDGLRFLDNVLQWFIDNAPAEMERAKYSAMMERSVGLGVMGFHGYLQSKGIPFESALAKSQNMRFFSRLRDASDAANARLAEERGACPDAAEHGYSMRFTNMLAIAPTASISTIAGSSPGTEPVYANIFTQKTLDGAFEVRNPHLERLLESRGLNTQEMWTDIAMNKGSVQHIEALTEWERDVFKTAFELDQRWIVDHAADRQPFICQSQSTNLFMRPDVSKSELLGVHVRAWKRGMKSLYYLRSESIGTSGSISKRIERVRLDEEPTDKPWEEPCLACQ